MDTISTITEKKEAKKKSCLQPTPKVLVSCRRLNGENKDLSQISKKSRAKFIQ